MSSVQALGSQDRRRVGAAREHQLTDGQRSRGQEVEVVMQAERPRLGAQRMAGTQPAQQAGAGDLGHDVVAVAAHLIHRPGQGPGVELGE
jgi:hypothetical protein